MKGIVRLLIWTGIILSFFNILWLAYDRIQFEKVSEWFIDLKANTIYIHLIFYGLMFSFISHILVGGAVLKSLKNEERLFPVGAGLVFLGSISFMSLFFEWAGLCDIINEYPKGFEINFELGIINVTQLLHLSFYLFSIVYLLVKNYKYKHLSPVSIFGRQLFKLMNGIGIVCGALGLLFVYGCFHFNKSLKAIEISFFIIILIPYMLILFYWLSQSFGKNTKKIPEDNQKTHLYKASLFALLFSVSLMIVFFIYNYGDINGPASSMWLPFLTFSSLTVFSSAALLYYKIN
ncbi:MAG TPA: hypothetical protein VHO90_14555 [Bacteroidales bacterium]|nr:hypothetical protein [Bacteroidales bacterium]